MIRIDRIRAENGKTIEPSQDWLTKAKEKTEKAIQDGPSHEVTDLYKDIDIKMALEKLFYDKCAYCESDLSAAEWDVEHYRPKGRVAERPDHPGYYWMAYKWENLYPSCKFCNQGRKDSPRFDDPRALPSQGKIDQFPVADEAHRAMTPGDDLTKERPLLLDPCNDEPENFFTYDIHGQIYALNENDRIAAETIRICHLQRRRLRDDRARTIIRVYKLMQTIQDARKAENAEIEHRLNLLLDDFTAPSSLHAGAARTVKRIPGAFAPGL